MQSVPASFSLVHRNSQIFPVLFSVAFGRNLD